VVEYASASCPHCARFNNRVFPAFKKKYVDTGQVRYVLREYLTQPVQVAAAGFLLARCSGADKYFPTLDDFFRSQEELYQTGEARRVIVEVGSRAGLSEAQVDDCLGDEAALKALNARVQRYVENDKIESTPSFVINGKPLPRSDHEVNLADLDAAIGPLLKARGRP
jgi:protein-disulfide isomerase